MLWHRANLAVVYLGKTKIIQFFTKNYRPKAGAQKVFGMGENSLVCGQNYLEMCLFSVQCT